MADKKTTIFRRAKDRDNPYVMIDRTFFENDTLSWKAKGLMGYLLSRPNDWTVIQADLVNRSKDGVHATRAGIAELIKAGYLTRHTIRNEDGTIREHEIQVHEIPVPVAQRTIPRKNKRRPAASQPALPIEPQSGFQHVVNQHVDKQHVENRTLLSTDVLSTDPTKKPDAPAGAVSPEQEAKADIESFHNGDVPKVHPPKTKPKTKNRDVVEDIVQLAAQRNADPLWWLRPGTPCGDHDYLEPYHTFCNVIQREPSTIGEDKTKDWLCEFERIAIVSVGNNGDSPIIIQPGTMAQAIRAIRDDWSFEQKKWTTPHNTKFAELVEHTAAQISTGQIGDDNGKSASQSLGESGYDAKEIAKWAQTQTP